jgi:hypothetical protein
MIHRIHFSTSTCYVQQSRHALTVLKPKPKTVLVLKDITSLNFSHSSDSIYFSNNIENNRSALQLSACCTIFTTITITSYKRNVPHEYVRLNGATAFAYTMPTEAYSASGGLSRNCIAGPRQQQLVRTLWPNHRRTTDSVYAI